MPNAAGAAGSLDLIKLLLKYKWLLVATIVLGAALGVAAHYALLKIYPRWTAKAYFEGRPQSTDIDGNNLFNEVEMNRFLQTQARAIVGPSVLRSVVVDPRLVSQAPNWSKRFMELDTASGEERLNAEKAARELEEDVRARPIANTLLIELSMTHVKPEDATSIVSLVAEKYLDRLTTNVRNTQQERVSALTREIDTINAEIQSLTARRDSLIQRGSVDSLNEQASTVRAELNKINTTEIELRQDLEATRKQLQQLEEEKNNPAGSAFSDRLISEVERDPVVLEVKQQIAGVEAELQSMRNRGIGINNPQYKILQSRQEGFVARLEEEKNKQLRKLFDGELDGVRRTVQQLESQELEISARKEALNRRVIELTGATRQVEAIEEELTGKQEIRARLFQSKIDQGIIDRGGGNDRITLEEPARMPSIPSFPKLEVLIPAGILVLTGLVGGLVFVRELIDQRVKGPGDVALIPRARLLGWVPDAAEDPSGQGNVETSLRDRPKGIVAESFRQLRASIVRRVAAGDHRTVLFVGSLPGSGTTTAVLNTALAFASTDKRVLVIDANFRRPALHKALGLQDSPGLADALAGRDLASLVQATSTPNLDLLSAGSKEQRVFERLGAAAMSDVLAKARAAYDIVLIDTAPAVVAGDAMALAQKCDASVLIVRAMAEKRGMIARVKNELTDARAEFLGIVINAVRSAAGGYMKGNIKVASQYQED
jgi:capsular exopolysaccharide synthesis family protein